MLLQNTFFIVLFFFYKTTITKSVYFGRVVYRFRDTNNIADANHHSAESENTCFSVPEKLQDAHCNSQYCKETALLSQDNELTTIVYSSHHNYIPAKRFGSACVKCIACLAVVEQILKTLQNIWKILRYRYRFKLQFVYGNHERLRQLVDENIRELCHQGFQNYALRDYKGKILLTDVTSNTKLISSLMDGYWTEKLRNICTTFSREFDSLDLLVKFLELKESNKEEEIYNVLCRGYGVFGECRNLNVDNKMEQKCKTRKKRNSHVIFA